MPIVDLMCAILTRLLRLQSKEAANGGPSSDSTGEHTPILSTQLNTTKFDFKKLSKNSSKNVGPSIVKMKTTALSPLRHNFKVAPTSGNHEDQNSSSSDLHIYL
jgi:hypothetical protein